MLGCGGKSCSRSCACHSPYSPSPSVPLLSGDTGIAQTIALMQQLIDQGVKDPYVNRFAIEALQQFNAAHFNPLDEARVLYEIVRPGGYGGYRFVPDPVGPGGAKETLRSAKTFLEVGGGDCDDFTVAILSIMGTIGIPGRIITVASDPTAPDEFSHVYPEIQIDGQWIPADAARPGAKFGLAPQRVFRKKVWPSEISGGAAQETFSGVRHSLSGYHHVPCGPRPLSGYGLGRMGQGANEIAQDITAATAGASDIILASDASPYNIYGTVATLPGSGGLAVAPYAGYPSTALGIGTINPTTLMLFAGAFLLIMMMDRK
jgi:Transglutaminase-like superfamily